MDFLENLMDAVPKLTALGPTVAKVIIHLTPEVWMVGWNEQQRAEELDGAHVCNAELKVCADIHIKRSRVVATVRKCFV